MYQQVDPQVIGGSLSRCAARSLVS